MAAEVAEAVSPGNRWVPVVVGVGGVEGGGGGGAGVAGEALGAGAGDGGDVAGGVDLADDVASGLGEVEVPGGVKDDRGGKDEGDGECGDRCLRWCIACRGEEEQEEGCDPEWSVAGARRVCGALRTHGRWPGILFAK